GHPARSLSAPPSSPASPRLSLSALFFFSTLARPPTSTLFPYTTLFRSGLDRRGRHADARRHRGAHVRGPLRRGDQHPDDLHLGDQDLGRDRREVHRARRPYPARRLRRARPRSPSVSRKIQLYHTTLPPPPQPPSTSSPPTANPH